MTAGVEATVLRRYAVLLESFLDGRQTVQQFVDSFLDEWKHDRDSGLRTGDVIDHLMTGVDSFSDTPLDAWTINEEQLRREARDALTAIGS